MFYSKSDVFFVCNIFVWFFIGVFNDNFRPKIIKRQLKELETLKSTTPFTILDKDKLEVYDYKGAVVRRFKTTNIKFFVFGRNRMVMDMAVWGLKLLVKMVY
ncbi:hypothetical protein [Moraxella oblonga]|uniref:hypothetical protein n=1 Tax=Moraxella oblonga TaxID=200413 RepID=UPI000831C70D|nr:hypothetical protein [Moraxella oblonga]